MSPLAILSILIVLVLPVPGSQLYGAKRGRPQYSSLIPFPRVGRSGGVREYYGQKRGGKSGLIPFPRVGKRGGPWDGLVDAAFPRGLAADALAWQPAEPRPLLTLLPRIGRSGREKEEGSVALLEEVELAPSKRQSLIPFPRVGRSPVNSIPSDSVDFDDLMTRERRASPDRAFHRRLLRSIGDFKRRITRSGSGTFKRRITRSGSGTFKRRITRSLGSSGERSMGSQGSTTAFARRILREASTGQAGFRRRITKKQSLIPFPRTGRSSSGAPGELERDQVYIYEEEDEEPEEDTGLGLRERPVNLGSSVRGLGADMPGMMTSQESLVERQGPDPAYDDY